MNQSNYDEQNRFKTSFHAAYAAPTPHRYLHNMTAVDYRMADYMNPFLTAVVDASVSPPQQRPVRILDLGCSYGVSGALLKTGCAYQELAKFFRYETSSEYSSCVTESKRWLESRVAREDVEVVGFDSSAEAIRFATASRMIDKGITRNLEENESELTEDERSLIRQCDVLLSTGVIGYVTEKTVNPILDEFGHDVRGPLGAVAIMSVLELFDPKPIAESFAEHGYRFGQLQIRMPQRRFADEKEREGMLEALRDRGKPTAVQDSEDQMFANLYVAARPQSFEVLSKRMSEVAEALPFDSRGCGQSIKHDRRIQSSNRPAEPKPRINSHPSRMAIQRYRPPSAVCGSEKIGRAKRPTGVSLPGSNKRQNVEGSHKNSHTFGSHYDTNAKNP